MKKKIKLNKKIVLCAVLAFLVIAGAVVYAFLPHSLNYDIKGIKAVGSDLEIKEETEDSVTVVKKSGGDVKILLFTDMHLDGKNGTSQITVSNFVESIQKEKPDLVLLGGDNVTSAFNRGRARQLGEIFEKLGVYWGGVLGNHEGDNAFSISRGDMVDIFASFDHCLMRKGLSSATGDCNYALNIEGPDGKLVQTFFFFDTFDMMSDGRKAEYGFQKSDKVTDGVRKDQVSWYETKLGEVKAKYGACKSIVLLHIPLPQYKTALDEGLKPITGVQLENPCVSGVDTGLFDAIKKGGSTTAVFCGHDHMNNYRLLYQDILLCYIESSGYGSYHTGTKLGYAEKDWLQGYTRLTVHENGAYDIMNVRYSEGME